MQLFTGEDLYTADVDIYAPCAMGATINDATVNKIKAKIIAGAANNQLLMKMFTALFCKEGYYTLQIS
jgi:leucine dehydrogenase